ncbi:MAG: hypothetical protein ACM3XM_11745 [Mycobacterium leprae]
MMLLWVIPVVILLYFLVERNGKFGSNWGWILIALLGLPLVGMLFMGGRGGYGMMGGRGGYGMMGGRGFGRGYGPGMMQGWGAGNAPNALVNTSPVFFWVRAALCVLFVIALIVLAFVAIKRFSASRPAREDEAVRELRMRLARGEVSAEEFEVALQKLNQK